MKWIKRGSYVVFLLLCVVAGAALHWSSKIINSFRERGTSVGDVISGLRNPRSLFPGQDHLTILLIGQDYNHDKRGFIYSKGSRADTVMLLRVDLVKKSIRACSIPRDTYVTAPDGKSGKINATFSRGGAELLKGTIHDLFDVQIDNYVVIKADAVREIVDSIGGVEIVAMDEMNYDDNWGGLHVHLSAGRQVVDGKGAEGFIRFREVNRYHMDSQGHVTLLQNVKHSKEEGDLRRTARQQELIHSLIKSANSSSNIMRADEIIDTGFKQVETDLSRVQCLALATILKGATKESMVAGTVPGSDSKKGGVYYYVLDESRAKPTVDWLIKDDENAMRRTIRVEVRNGTRTIDIANAVAAQLSSEGYLAASLGNAAATPMTTIVYKKASYEAAAKQIQSELGAATIAQDSMGKISGPEIRIVIGDDLVKRARNLVGH